MSEQGLCREVQSWEGVGWVLDGEKLFCRAKQGWGLRLWLGLFPKSTGEPWSAIEQSLQTEQ